MLLSWPIYVKLLTARSVQSDSCTQCHSGIHFFVWGSWATKPASRHRPIQSDCKARWLNWVLGVWYMVLVLRLSQVNHFTTCYSLWERLRPAPMYLSGRIVWEPWYRWPSVWWRDPRTWTHSDKIFKSQSYGMRDVVLSLVNIGVNNDRSVTIKLFRVKNDFS